jgi:hypothetical protein
MVQELADRAEIADLVTRLGRWLDADQASDPRALFDEAVRVRTPGGEAEGLDRVVAQARRTHERARTQHVITNVLVELDGDRARAGANLLVAFVPEAGGAEPYTLGERYAFEAVRGPAGWRLSRIEVEPVWRSAALAA